MAGYVLKRKPTRKPLKPVFDSTHPAVRKADHLLSFDRVDENGAPWDEAQKAFWATNTTNGTTPYKKQSVSGSMQLARQDIDEAGIAYQAPATGLNPNNVPVFVIVGFTVLQAPSASWRGIISLGNLLRDSSGCWNITSNGTTEFQSWIGGSRFLAPIEVGKKHFIIYRYDGVDQHQQYNSALGYWQTLTQAASNGTTSDSLWLGTAYTGELPVAFDFLVSSVGSAPSIATCESLVKNPYQVFKPKAQYIDISVAAGGFQAAWARNANQIIGMNQ